MKIKELPMDQKTTITLLLTSIEEKETRNSSPYCTLTLTDGIDTIIAQLWNTKKENVKVQEKTLTSAERCTTNLSHMRYISMAQQQILRISTTISFMLHMILKRCLTGFWIVLIKVSKSLLL